MLSKKHNILGLDVGKHVIKLVEYSRTKKQVITIAKLFVEPGDWESGNAFSQKLKSWVMEKKKAGKVELVAAIGGEHSVVKQIDLPTDEKDLRNAVNWEMEQYLASPLGDFSLDYQEMGDTGEFKTLLAAAHRKSEIEKIVQIIDNPPELNLSILDIDVFAAINAFEANYPEKISGKTVIIKADLHNIACILTQNGEFLQMKTIAVPEEIINGEEDQRSNIISDLISKIKTHVDTSFKENRQPISPDFLCYCGDFASDYEFGQAIEGISEGEVERLNSFKKVYFPHDAEYADKVLETAPQCATALGLALRYKGDRP